MHRLQVQSDPKERLKGVYGRVKTDNCGKNSQTRDMLKTVRVVEIRPITHCPRDCLIKAVRFGPRKESA